MAGGAQEDRWRKGAPWVFLACVALLYAGLFVWLGGLSEELRKDERFFWPASQHFAARWVPTLEDLRTYPAPGTPLPFLVYGALEHATGRGLVLGRILNGALALAVVALIAGVRSEGWGARALCACGLLACPYFTGSSLYLYTDAPATALVALGMLAYVRGRHAWSGLCMALAIACRQYMVAFPVAIGVWEFWKAARAGRGWRPVLTGTPAWLPHVLAAATLLGWILLFGGPAPQGAAEQYRVVTADPATVLPRNSLYFLACVGAYFVAVEAVLFRRFAAVRGILSLRAGAWALVLGVLFVLFPPLQNTGGEVPSMGYMDKAARLLLSDWARMATFWALAVLVAARFGRLGVGALLVACNTLVMMKAHIGWDKYAVPLLGALWLLRSRGVLEGCGTTGAGSEAGAG